MIQREIINRMYFSMNNVLKEIGIKVTDSMLLSNKGTGITRVVYRFDKDTRVEACVEKLPISVNGCLVSFWKNYVDASDSLVVNGTNIDMWNPDNDNNALMKVFGLDIVVKEAPKSIEVIPTLLIGPQNRDEWEYEQDE